MPFLHNMEMLPLDVLNYGIVLQGRLGQEDGNSRIQTCLAVIKMLNFISNNPFHLKMIQTVFTWKYVANAPKLPENSPPSSQLKFGFCYIGI